jgi:16S rRNA (cytidine1402-2'-O)-methyltransferase
MAIGCLYIVSTPIGNYADISLRALETMREADAIVCEEYRQGSTLLKRLEIPKKELLLLNEHNEAEQADELLKGLLQGKTLALISDCGTPAFADPGTKLIRLAHQFQVPVVPVPGASSLMALISISPLPLEEFYFAGFLPRKSEARQAKWTQLSRLNVPIILMDTPYRLGKLLQEVKSVYGKSRLLTLAIDMTMPGELILHGMVEEILRLVGERKGEFMLVIH